jgi:P-type Ca2+ transporter type 2C
MKSFYQLTLDEVFARLSTSASGLSNDAIPARQKEYGLNALQEAKQKSRWAILLEQFNDVMIIILIIAVIISFVVGEHTDAFVILAIIIGNAWLGYSQEYNAEESMRGLKKMAAQHALVIRNDNPAKVNSEELVPGDIILMEAGDIVPADARLIEESSFKTDESSLTGESFAVDKKTDAIGEENLVPGDQHNMVFKGTLVTNGSAKAVVTTTGMKTEIGKIAGLLQVDTPDTPLQKRLTVFSKQLAVAVIAICLFVFGFGMWRGEPFFQVFLTALSLAVAALPEALPAVITIALAQGAARMVKQKALIRKLPAVETLGSVTYICSDKTGTLTQNKMTVEKTTSSENKEDLLRHAMILNNEVRFTKNDGLLGDSTETALVVYALEHGGDREDSIKKFPLLDKLPFDSERMRMSTLHRFNDKFILFVKGAPAKVIELLSPKYRTEGEALLKLNEEWAANGLRVLLFAYRIFDQQPADLSIDLENDLEYLGMAAMIDPPREEVIAAIDECKSAGIRTVMITGDQPLTAKAIAERLRMMDDGRQEVKKGSDLEPLPEQELNKLVPNIAVYARVSPEQKLRIVKALQTNGEFVAMTGDGVNDAPSLKQADIGLAMGITGTDVSKDASDIILLDDNFATIVRAVKEGRRIYDNIKKFILYVLSCNLSEILTILIAPLLGFVIPLLPIHILWINLVTDGLPGIALVAERAEDNIMERPPRPPKENLFAGGLIHRIIVTGIIMTGAAIGVQYWAITQGYSVNMQQTMVFTTLCFVQLANVVSVRSAYYSMFSKRLFHNPAIWGAIALTVVLQFLIIYLPFGERIFRTSKLPLDAMEIILGVVIVCFVLFELVKYFFRKKVN